MMRDVLLLPVTLVLATSCQVASSRWNAGADARIPAVSASTLVAPAGWKFTRLGDELLLTVDGADLQAVRVTFRKQARGSGRPYDANALPSELAEQHVAELEALTEGQVEILANEPATVGGRAGFRLRARLNRHAQRLPVDLYEIYGVGHGEGLYLCTYGAFETHFFARDLAAFERMVASFQLP